MGYCLPMKENKSCRYCKSPSRNNPCWWFLDHPNLLKSGGDPPCYGEIYDEDIEKDNNNIYFICLFFFILFAPFIVYWLLG